MNCDEKFMKLALGEAKKGHGRVSPNPLVGAVLVKKNKVLKKAHHEYFGGPHAELNVLSGLSIEETEGSVLYVTLEPCCPHKKKTPPCTDLLIRKKIGRIVICNRDPNPLVSGQGIALLIEAGIDVKFGVLKGEGEALNKVFFKFMKVNRPYVHVKYAQTADGKLASISGDSKWISDQAARKEGHYLRLIYDGVLIGKKTANMDNPSLTVRYGHESRKECPFRIVVGGLKGLNRNLKIFSDKYSHLTKVLCKYNETNLLLKSEFEKKGIEVILIKLNDNESIPVEKILIELSKRNISSILIEGGASIISQFLIKNEVDKITSYIVPKIIGSGIDFFKYEGIEKMNNAMSFKNPKFRIINDQMVLEAEGLII